MTTWILIWTVTTFGLGFNGPVSITTGSAIFHSQKACEEAAEQIKPHGNKAFCIQDEASETH